MEGRRAWTVCELALLAHCSPLYTKPPFSLSAHTHTRQASCQPLQERPSKARGGGVCGSKAGQATALSVQRGAEGEAPHSIFYVPGQQAANKPTLSNVHATHSHTKHLSMHTDSLY